MIQIAPLLNAPKGLRADRGTLWTGDLDQVIGVEMGQVGHVGSMGHVR